MSKGFITRHIYRPTAMGRKVLVCSIGNPGTFLNTRHSAGHTITTLLAESFDHGPFSKSKLFGGDVSFPANDQTYILWQSRSQMNISGKGVKTAWDAFLLGLGEEEKKNAVLVVVHDEMEVALGGVKVKKTGSAGGHNGLINIISHLQTNDFTRIGVGIGRPESRQSHAVSNYVLGKFTARENSVIKDKSLPLVIQKLKEIATMPT